jgi:CRISPR/Cas system-associated exonuclease Cas4 (RecB family)
MKTIRASKIGAFLYCQRAWWYARQGLPSENQESLASGRQLHERHGRAVAAASCLQVLAYALLLLALILAVVYLTGKVL